MKSFKTTKDVLHVPAGSPVTFDDKKVNDNTDMSGKLLCSVPSGGHLFFAKDELEEVTK